jgi:diaminohydroxyphosphoribosylaminopyrimidine deaminase/5-amino-6-(5-phosphoribosylamino)uracil reductase
MALEPEEYMERALDLAEQGRGYVSPNPMVGAVIVKDGTVIGQGYHRRYGEAHAEIEALRDATGDVSGATMYVTLEPCCHYGKTPPCTKATIEAGIGKVVMAMEDPHQRVAGKGRTELVEAGIEVESGLLEDRARKMNESFVKFATTGLPFVIAKAAMTLDGKIATRTGHSQWITGEPARERVHWLRAGVDAVMVGSGTAEADDPRLTTRTASGNGRDAVRIVVDGDAKTSPDRQVFSLQSSAPALLAVKTTAPAERKSALAAALGALAKKLAERNIASVMIEGGGGLLAAAFDAGIVDKALFFVAPRIVGGKEAPTPVEGVGFATVDEAIRLRDLSVERIGDDILIEGYVVK